MELPIGDWMTTVAPSLNQEVLRFVFLDLHTLPGWKVAQIISARHALLSDGNPRANHLQLSTYRQASVNSQNSMNITRASSRSQHQTSTVIEHYS
ncbi:MAG TPA: hypothetical protein VNV88_02285, partial [Candidatus Solibacter sp.]|nr:hypothetical protein [Candidatus Solibacter sp.]